jgi:LysR family glycine cleavage system transcriptional activator
MVLAMSRRMPPLNPLHVFEVSARLGGFSRAAADLNVTQSAVSRQIAVLESYLGVRLFHRERNGAKLTEAGIRFAGEIAEPFARIAAAAGRLTDRKPTEPLQIRAYATFATKWLIPRLPKFHERYPRALIRVSNVVKPIDFSRETVELAIQLGEGYWPGTKSILLFKDVIQPVCSPALLKRGKLNTIEDLNRHTLLHSYYRRQDWPDWLAAVGHADLPDDRGMMFDSSVQTYQAAVEGLGVAIGQRALLSHELESGQLVPLFDRPVERPLGYHLVWPTDRPESQKLETFKEWLLKEIAADPALHLPA